MEKRNIVVIGASSGGVDALIKIVRDLPADLDASLFIVWHMSSEAKGILPDLLNKVGRLPAAHAHDNEPIQPGRIYIAPPDHHLLIEEGLVRVTRGPKENRFRPAVDPLFRSAAYIYGEQVIGVVLSGGLDDGTAGLWRVKVNGGLAVVQDPADAEVGSMPENALRDVAVDYCLPAAEIAELLVRLVQEDVTRSTDPKDEQTKLEIDIAAEKNIFRGGKPRLGVLSPYACPECHGVLSRIADGDLIRFRCHTGHAYSEETLMNALTEKIEENLYSAIRGMEECILLLNHLGDHYAEVNQPKLAATYFRKAKEVMERSALVRNAVHDHEQLSRERLMEEVEKDR